MTESKNNVIINEEQEKEKQEKIHGQVSQELTDKELDDVSGGRFKWLII